MFVRRLWLLLLIAFYLNLIFGALSVLKMLRNDYEFRTKGSKCLKFV